MLYGVTPSRVVARRCRLSYGVRFNRRWTAEDRRCQAQHGYPRRFTHRATFAPYADGGSGKSRSGQRKAITVNPVSVQC